MSYERITRPDQLAGLTDAQLFQRLKPLLRKGGLLHSPLLRERIRANLVSVCWDLALQWQENPRLGQGQVSFADFFAAKLCNELRHNDRRENPDIHDTHGKYDPHRAPLPLSDRDLPERWFPFTEQTSPVSQQGDDWPRELAAALAANGIAPASSSALLDHIRDIHTGKTTSPYKLARAQGLSTTEARYQPASAAYTAIIDYLSHAATTPA